MITIGSLLALSSASGHAQQPLNELVAQVGHAIAIIDIYDERGNTVTSGSGFFIAADRVVTNLQLIDSERHIRIKTFSGTTISVSAVVTRYPEANIAIVQIARPARDITPLQVGRISGVVLNSARTAQWNVTANGDWSFEHIATRLHVMATLTLVNNEEPIIKLKGYANGTATSVPR